MAKLTKLHVENFKRIQAVDIEPEGNITIVGGMNEQGKYSLPDAISVLLQGKATKIPEPVRKGAKKATITCEIKSGSGRRQFGKINADNRKRTGKEFGGGSGN